MTNLYERFDKFMMNRTNEAVQAWNWTTGRTKSDLASILTVGANFALVCTGYDHNVHTGNILAPICLLNAALSPRYLKKREEKEISAAERGLKDLEVEAQKQVEKLIGTYYMTVAPIVALIPGIGSTFSRDAMITSGLFAASNYVMRADCLPPRKNALSRGLEKIRETLQEAVLQPQHLGLNYSDLEEIK